MEPEITNYLKNNIEINKEDVKKQLELSNANNQSIPRQEAETMANSKTNLVKPKTPAISTKSEPTTFVEKLEIKRGENRNNEKSGRDK